MAFHPVRKQFEWSWPAVLPSKMACPFTIQPQIIQSWPYFTTGFAILLLVLFKVVSRSLHQESMVCAEQASVCSATAAPTAAAAAPLDDDKDGAAREDAESEAATDDKDENDVE